MLVPDPFTLTRFKISAPELEQQIPIAAMKNLIILTEVFPPINRTAALRPGSWANNLFDHGYFPIVVTRANGEGTDEAHEVTERYEVFRVF